MTSCRTAATLGALTRKTKPALSAVAATIRNGAAIDVPVKRERAERSVRDARSISLRWGMRTGISTRK